MSMRQSKTRRCQQTIHLDLVRPGGPILTKNSHGTSPHESAANEDTTTASRALESRIRGTIWATLRLYGAQPGFAFRGAFSGLVVDEQSPPIFFGHPQLASLGNKVVLLSTGAAIGTMKKKECLPAAAWEGAKHGQPWPEHAESNLTCQKKKKGHLRGACLL
jgi:hypothetical protein